MRIIGNETLWSFSPSGQLKERTCFQIRAGGASFVKDYTDLATKIATLQFENPDYMLLFRGQHWDYTRTTQSDKRISTLMPSLLRSNTGNAPSSSTLVSRFKELARAERLLVDAYEREDFDEVDRLRRQTSSRRDLHDPVFRNLR